MTYPAPAYLEDDSWFGPATLSEKQMSIKQMEQKLIEEEILLGPESVEVANIHEVMYNIATSTGKTTVQHGGWMSGTGMNQFK